MAIMFQLMVTSAIILGGFSTPGIGTVDSLRGGTLMRERAQQLGALQVFAATEITGLDVQNGRVHAVRTTRGDIRAETVVICCGIWSPRIARMAGASIPLTPAVHQMISVGPVPQFADTLCAALALVVFCVNMFGDALRDVLDPRLRGVG